MRRTILLGLTLASALLAACRGSSTRKGGADEPPVDPSPSATIQVSDPSGGIGPFAIDALERLVIQVDAAHLPPGSHGIRVDVTGPGGTLYAQLPAAVVADGERQAHVSTALQVRGSTIESFRQTGTWQLVATVDGTALTSASVDLTE